MNKTSFMLNILGLACLFSTSFPLFACPDMQGTYKVEQGSTQLYLQKSGDNAYQVVLDIPTYPLMLKKAVFMDKEERVARVYQTALPECTLHIARFGYLIPFQKGSTYNLHFDSQDYQKTFNTDYVLKFNESPNGITGLSKTANSLPEKAIEKLAQ